MESGLSTRVRRTIRSIHNFPKEGFVYRDISPVLYDHALLSLVVKDWARHYRETLPEGTPTAIVGVESRGFIFGVPLALELGVPFIMCRKKGKLPGKTHCESYDQAYAKGNAMEILDVAFPEELRDKDKTVIIVDDFMSSGGSLECAIKLFQKVGARTVGVCTLCEYPLGGRQKMKEGYGIDVYTTLSYGSLTED